MSSDLGFRYLSVFPCFCCFFSSFLPKIQFKGEWSEHERIRTWVSHVVYVSYDNAASREYNCRVRVKHTRLERAKQTRRLTKTDVLQFSPRRMHFHRGKTFSMKIFALNDVVQLLERLAWDKTCFGVESRVRRGQVVHKILWLRRKYFMRHTKKLSLHSEKREK